MNQNINNAGVILLAVLLSLSTTMFLGCGQELDAQPAGSLPVSVNVVGFVTQEEDLKDSISVVGTLEANESVEIKSEINGTIEKINFQEGQEVKKGDVLFQIEKRKLEASYDQAQANLKLAETTADRYERLVKTKAVSQQEYDQTVASLESNRATVSLVKEQLQDATITAPFDGVTGERFISTGQFVEQGKSLSFLFSQDPMKVVFHVPERYLGQIKKGQTINMKVAAYEGKKYKGSVYFIDPQVDEITRTAVVKATVPNPEGDLRQGMFANLELIVSLRKNAIMIPEMALIVKGDSVSVFVVGDDDTVSLREVETGKRINGVVEIRHGLKVGETIVTEGYQKLGPGSKVNVRFEDLQERKFYEII